MAITNEAFEEACKQVQPEFVNKHFRIHGKNHDRRMKLNIRFRRIAERYFQHWQVGTATYFPADIVMRISVVMDVFVNDIAKP